MAKPTAPATNTLSKKSSMISVKTVSKHSKKLMIFVVVLVIVGLVIYYYYTTKWKPDQLLENYMKTFHKEYSNEIGDMFNNSDINNKTCDTFNKYKKIYENSAVETARKKVLNNKYSAQIYEKYDLPKIDATCNVNDPDGLKKIKTQLVQFDSLFDRFFVTS